jgi:chromosome partitioning protein
MITSIIHYKGGVGKTTTCCNLAGAAYEAGHRVLVFDLDPQGSASTHFGAARDATVHDWIRGESPLSEAVQRVRPRPDRPRLGRDDSTSRDAPLTEAGRSPVAKPPPPGVIGVVPSDERLTVCQGDWRKEGRLDALSELLRSGEARTTIGTYDFVFVDCPPGADYLAANALRASDVVLSTMALSYMSVTGLLLVAANVRLAREQGYSPRWLVLPTMYRSRRVQTRRVLDKLTSQLGTFPEGSVLAPIHESVDLAYSFDARQTVFEYAPEGRGAHCYRLAFQQLAHVRAGLSPPATRSDSLPARPRPV